MTDIIKLKYFYHGPIMLVRFYFFEKTVDSLGIITGVVKCPRCGFRRTFSFCPRAKDFGSAKHKHEKQAVLGVKVGGEVLEDSPICAHTNGGCALFWLIANCKNGISAYEHETGS